MKSHSQQRTTNAQQLKAIKLAMLLVELRQKPGHGPELRWRRRWRQMTRHVLPKSYITNHDNGDADVYLGRIWVCATIIVTTAPCVAVAATCPETWCHSHHFRWQSPMGGWIGSIVISHQPAEPRVRDLSNRGRASLSRMCWHVTWSSAILTGEFWGV